MTVMGPASQGIPLAIQPLGCRVVIHQQMVVSEIAKGVVVHEGFVPTEPQPQPPAEVEAEARAPAIAQARAYLTETDWYVTRQAETGTPMCTGLAG